MLVLAYRPINDQIIGYADALENVANNNWLFEYVPVMIGEEEVFGLVVVDPDGKKYDVLKESKPEIRTFTMLRTLYKFHFDHDPNATSVEIPKLTSGKAPQ